MRKQVEIEYRTRFLRKREHKCAMGAYGFKPPEIKLIIFLGKFLEKCDQTLRKMFENENFPCEFI